MDLYEAVRARRSVRKYADRPIEPEKLERVLEAARLAPSSNNKQQWKFIVVTDREMRAKLVQAAMNQQFVGEAPVVLVACSLNPKDETDAIIALDHVTLAAAAEGLGTCWIGAFHPDPVRALLGIPAEVPVTMLMPLGYPADAASARRPRKPREQLFIQERWA